MTSPLQQIFWRAVDDLNAGRVEPVERYLELVAHDERDELAEMLATVLAERGPAPGPADRRSEGYARALAAIDEVTASAGPAGVLPGALRTMRHARGIEPNDVVEALAADHNVHSEEGRQTLARLYHRLEHGKLVGTNLTRPLLDTLARVFQSSVEDLAAGARQMRPARRLGSVPAMGRPGGESSPRSTEPQAQTVAPDPDVRRAEQLFLGGDHV
jgi:hypothetical protein